MFQIVSFCKIEFNLRKAFKAIYMLLILLCNNVNARLQFELMHFEHKLDLHCIDNHNLWSRILNARWKIEKTIMISQNVNLYWKYEYL